MCILAFAFRGCQSLGSFILQDLFQVSEYLLSKNNERGGEEETNCVAQFDKLFCGDLSSLLFPLALTCDKQYLLVGNGSGSCIHLCQVRR